MYKITEMLWLLYFFHCTISLMYKIIGDSELPLNQFYIEEKVMIQKELSLIMSIDIKGSISLNKLADFVVLDEDITQVDPFAIKDIKVVKTVIGGKTVYEG